MSRTSFSSLVAAGRAPWLSALLAVGAALACRDKIPERATGSVPVSAVAKAPSAELPRGRPQEWVESKRFRLRVLDARPCDEASGATGRFRLGVAVEIEATGHDQVSPVFASPNGVELEKNGKIFRPAREPVPGCEPMLEPARLLGGEVARGMLVFDVPDVLVRSVRRAHVQAASLGT